VTDFAHSLNYTASNEDGRSELRALQLTEKDTVVCITGSGSRTLDLLTAGPRRIFSVDMNPCQGFLMELKRAAIRNLSYDEHLGFLGVEEDHRRTATYALLRPQLRSASRAYWDGRLPFVARGIVYQGRWERYFRRLAAFLRLTRGSVLRDLFEAADVERQYSLYVNQWDGPFWKGFIRSISPNAVWRYAFGDPGFFRYVPDDFSVPDYLLERFTAAFRTRLLRESPFMTLLLQGRYSPNECLPLHLLREQYRVLQERLDTVTVVTARIDEFLRSQGMGGVNAFSLSDVGSYISPEQYRDLWIRIADSGMPGARFCERQFLVKRPLPDIVAVRVQRDRSLECALEASDDSAFYTFVVGSLVGR
jgi:S-adenosylmethionine-diacylglycerol 3-amino-3-carboxypropyl transferase